MILKSSNKKFFKYLKIHHFEINLKLSDFLYKKEKFKFFESKDFFVNEITKEISESFEEMIKNSIKKDKRINLDKRKNELDEMFNGLFQNTRPNFEISKFFEPQVKLSNSNNEEFKLSAKDLKWFVKFNYSLRNYNIFSFFKFDFIRKKNII